MSDYEFDLGEVILGLFVIVAIIVTLCGCSYAVTRLTGWYPATDPAWQDQIDKNCPAQFNTNC